MVNEKAYVEKYLYDFLNPPKGLAYVGPNGEEVHDSEILNELQKFWRERMFPKRRTLCDECFSGR